MPRKPNPPRAKCNNGLRVGIILRKPNRQTKGRRTIRPARNLTNKTSKAGKVRPKNFTSDAITISKNAPVTTKIAPCMFGERFCQGFKNIRLILVSVLNDVVIGTHKGKRCLIVLGALDLSNGCPLLIIVSLIF